MPGRTRRLAYSLNGLADLKVQITGNHAGTAASSYTGGGGANGGWLL